MQDNRMLFNNEAMKRIFIGLAGMAIAAAAGLAGCSQKGARPAEGFPKDFAFLPDVEMVRYVMDNASPDSVARFICDAALGRIPEGSIDTLAVAAAYTYENYNDSCLIIFSKEFDDYSANLPLADKMRIYAMAGEADPQRLGYQLGLEYVSHVRDNQMTTGQIKEELSAFRTACADDTLLYRRFLKGFQTALRIDRGKDLDESVYKEFAEQEI